MTSVPTARREPGALRLAAVFLAGAVFALAASGSAGSAASDEGPARLGLVEGQATIERAGAPGAAYENQPLLPGDSLTTAPGARVEAVLADDTAVFVAGDGEVVFATLAGEGDDELANLLRLARGELLIASEGEAETRIDTDNASVYVGAGSYRIERTGDSTLVIARRGEAELRTRRGAVSVAAGKQAWIEGDGIPVVERAAGVDAVERWAATLGHRRERLAYEDEGELDFAFDDDFGFGFWDWDSGGFVCVRNCGSAGRTRPPHPSRGPGSADDPGRSAVPIGGEPGSETDDGIEIAVGKPWPLDEASTAGASGPTPVPKPPVETPADEASVRGAFVETAEVAPKPSEPEPASSVSAAAWDPGPAADSAPASDGGSSAARPAEAPSGSDAGAEPNR